MTELSEMSNDKLVCLLHEARQVLGDRTAELKAKHQELEPFETARTNAQTYASAIELALREKGVQTFLSTGEKHICPGVNAAQADAFQAYDYDEAQALLWAQDKKMCLKLDTEAFAAICAQISLRPDFVNVTEEPGKITIRIDRDLTSAVSEILAIRQGV